MSRKTTKPTEETVMIEEELSNQSTEEPNYKYCDWITIDTILFTTVPVDNRNGYYTQVLSFATIGIQFPLYGVINLVCCSNSDSSDYESYSTTKPVIIKWTE